MALALLVLSTLLSASGWHGPPLRCRSRVPCMVVRMEIRVTDEGIASLSARELKDELSMLGEGAAAAACFEKSELVSALRLARARAASSPPPPPPPTEAAAATDTAGAAGAAATAPSPATAAMITAAFAAARDYVEDERAQVRGLSVPELRQRLADRSVGWADLFEKSELVARLAGLVAEELQFCPSGRVPLGRVAELSEDEARAELADGTTPLLLDVYAKWCGPCQMMAPHLEKAALELKGKVRIVKVDTDAATRLSGELQVRGLPTLIAFKSGKPVHRVEGALSLKAILQLCEQHCL
ncbi:thioredoxin-like protein [Pavlovales sp. CCMP2436]|nr:thioredoxin-like protein [Pavlovales sp. CCMP2436]